MVPGIKAPGKDQRCFAYIPKETVVKDVPCTKDYDAFTLGPRPLTFDL